MTGIKDWTGMIALAALLLAVSAITPAQEMYRWVDKTGEVHYSDQPPPPEVKEYRSLTRSGTAAGAPAGVNAGADSYEDQEADFQRRRAQESEQQSKAEQAETERKKNCDLARSQYNTISAGGRISRRDAQGEMIYLSDEQIAEESEQAREEMEKWCNN
jgi:hypothetical protein